MAWCSPGFLLVNGTQLLESEKSRVRTSSTGQESQLADHRARIMVDSQGAVSEASGSLLSLVLELQLLAIFVT